MPAPTATATLDKPAYASGDVMTLTVDYVVDAVDISISVEGLGGTASPTTTAKVRRITITDPDRAWTLKSDTGARAIYTAKA